MLLHMVKMTVVVDEEIFVHVLHDPDFLCVSENVNERN